MLTPREAARRHDENELRRWQQELETAQEPGRRAVAQFWVDYFTKQLQPERRMAPAERGGAHGTR